MEASKSIKFNFQVTNNVAEYEALIVGLRLAKNKGIKSIQAYSDLQLLVQPLRGEYEVRVARLKKYSDLAKEMMEKFDKVPMEKVPQQENAQVDALAKIDECAEE